MGTPELRRISGSVEPEHKDHKVSSPENSVFSEQQKDVLKKRTEALVKKIIEENAKVVVFLDRAARPISWMLNEAWETYADGEEMPKIKFANIGREKGEVLGLSGVAPGKYVFDEDKDYIQKEEAYWSDLDKDGYVKRIRRDLKDIIEENEDIEKRNKDRPYEEQEDTNSLLIVDDYSQSGYTMGVAYDFFRHHLSELSLEDHSFLKESDKEFFSAEDWQGTYLPWNEDKAYTLLSEEDDPAKLEAVPERDPEKRKKGIALKQEIKSMFKRD